MKKIQRSCKLEIPKILHFLAVQGYDPSNASLAGVGVWVWVDPPRSLLQAYADFDRQFAQACTQLLVKYEPSQAEKLHSGWLLLRWARRLENALRDAQLKRASMTFLRKAYDFYSVIWSQAPDIGTHWTAEELRRINGKNPTLFNWLLKHTQALIKQHQDETQGRIRENSNQQFQADKTASLPTGGNGLCPWGDRVLPSDWLNAALAIIESEKKDSRDRLAKKGQQENTP
jgi:hypothetical protein